MLLSFEFKEVRGLPEPAAVPLKGRHEWGQGGSEPPGVGFNKLRPPASPFPQLHQHREPRRVPGQMPPSLLGFSKYCHVEAGVWGGGGDLDVLCSWLRKGRSKGRRMLGTLSLF